jgi:hypothetical protein
MFVLLVTVFGLAISAALLRYPVPFGAASGGRRGVVAFAYDLVCIVGMLAVLFPVACSKVLSTESGTEASQELGIRATRFMGVQIVHGHHTENAEMHELLVKGKSLCATCYGLLTGAVLSFVTVTVFGLSSSSVWTDARLAYFMYFLGFSGVVIGLSQFLISSIGARTRFVLAFSFVVGTGLMLVAADLLTANLIADLYVVLLAVFWLLSRISLSHRS